VVRERQRSTRPVVDNILNRIIELAGKNEGVENAATSQARHPPRNRHLQQGASLLAGARVNPVKYLDDVIVAM